MKRESAHIQKSRWSFRSLKSARSLGEAIDRIVVLFAILVIIGPILVYAWVALDADKASRTQFAMDRCKLAAKLAAKLVDEHCRAIAFSMQQLAKHPDIRLSPSNGLKKASQPLLDSAARDLESIASIACYSPAGHLLASAANKPESPPRNRAPLIARLAQTRARLIAYTEHHVERDTVLLAVPVEKGGRMVAALVAALPTSVFDGWLATAQSGRADLYVVDEEGHVLTSAGPSWHRFLPLRNYPPMRLAINGEEGSVQIDAPDGSEESFVGFAHASLPRCGVLVVQAVDTIHGPTNDLVQRLALLLLPMLLLVSGWAWQRIQSERRIGEMAAQLARQNEALRRADQAKSEFLANVSHDLRTPLAAMQVSISGFMESSKDPSAAEVKETLGVVSEEVDQLSARVRNLLDMARLEAGAEALSLEPADLTDIVSSALERVEPLTRGNRVRADFPADALMVDCDQTRLETVVINLLENAVKYTPEGSTIYLQGAHGRDEVMLRVWDEGPGLQPGDEEEVFKMYYRSGRGRAVRGTGVGLAICKAVIEAHGGKIGARRAETGGAEFWFTLPALPEMPMDREEEEAGAANA